MNRTSPHWIVVLAVVGAALAACSAGSGSQGSPGGPGLNGASSGGASSGGVSSSGASSGGASSSGAGSSGAGSGGSGSGPGAACAGPGGASSSTLAQSRLIGGATLDPTAFWPPTGQTCTTHLDASGTVPSCPPQAYLDECAGCHGPTGTGREGYPYPNIVQLTPHDFSAFQTIVRNGIVTPTLEMPFFKTEWVDDDDLRRIFAYLTQTPIVETHQCQTVAPMSASDIADAMTRGMTTWRQPDGKVDPAGIKTNVACAQCHAPDPLDFAYYGFPDGDILRRGLQHLPTTQIQNVVDMVHALRAKYSIGRRDPLQVRPFQPGGGMLPGASIVDRDAAFGQELVSMGLSIATKPLASPADADAALAEMWALDRHALRIPVPFDRYAEDIFHNPDGYVSSCASDIDACDDHGSIADWIPVAPHVQTNQASYYTLADTYLNDPTDANMESLQYAAGTGTMPGTYAYGTADFDTNKYQSLVLANYCIRLELTGQPGCYDKGVAPFPNKATIWNVGAEINLFGTNYETYASCDTGWQDCAAAPANLPQWPSHLLGDITPGATLSSNFSRLRHTWMTLWWTHFDPTLLVTGDPTAQKDEYFTRSLFWSNDNDEVFDGSPKGAAHPTYAIFSAYEVLMHNVATLENPGMASCSLWPASDFPCTAVDVRSGYYPDVINFAEQNQPQNPETDNNVHYQTLFEPQDAARRPTYQLVVANLYRLFFWKLIGSLQQDNWMCDPTLENLRIARAQEFLAQAETQMGNAAQDKTMFDTLSALMAKSAQSCPAQ